MKEPLLTLQPKDINGGRVLQRDDRRRFWLPAAVPGYSDAQIDDYSQDSFRWRPGVRLALRARFSHGEGVLAGTAGFGFWNAPFADGGRLRAVWPQAAWFFYGSPHTNLPLSATRPGRGWHVACLDVRPGPALALALAGPFLLVANQIPSWRRRLWARALRALRVDFHALDLDMTEWHGYELRWSADRVIFRVDSRTVYSSPCAPRGPLGFVCWLDNQYLVATPAGKLRWGVVPLAEAQYMEVESLHLAPLDGPMGA